MEEKKNLIKLNLNYNLEKIPKTTGVYFFLDVNLNPIYIGKANSLRERINQHLKDKENPKEIAIIKNSFYLKWQEVENEFEALLLEARLVHSLQPKYNSELKDDKSALYIVITKESYPKVQLTRKNDLGNIKVRLVFGPFTNSLSARNLLRQVRKLIPFCSEKNISKKPCFYSQINLCNPCPNKIEGLINKDEKEELRRKYLRNIKRIEFLLKGNGKKLSRQMQKEMFLYAREEKFEKASFVRDRLLALEALFRRRFFNENDLMNPNYLAFLYEKENRELQNMFEKSYEKPLNLISRIECYDISNLNFAEATASMVTFQKGVALKHEYRRFRIKGERRFDPEMLLEVLMRRFKHTEWILPDLLLIDGGTPQILKVYPKLKEKYPNLPLVVGIAKKPDRLFLAENLKLVRLSPDSLALHYLQRVRDEAHRFAKKYHLILRTNAFTKSLALL